MNAIISCKVPIARLSPFREAVLSQYDLRKMGLAITSCSSQGVNSLFVLIPKKNINI